ncbi:MAG TPA: hypothetical protein VFR84_10060 [Candidatus Angelobacter sp.]|nr:hypothetical protein [Candidatus Angelobacter sp.]
MKSYWIAAVVLVSAWPASSQAYAAGIGQMAADEKPAQQAPSPNPALTSNSSTPNQPAAAPQNKSGSYLLVELSRPLKASKLKPGDKIKAEVSQDVISHGKLIIPAETQIIGHVTEVNARDASNNESRLGIVFDRIVLKHFQDVNFQAVVQTVRPPVTRHSRVDEPSQMLPPSMIMGDLRGPSPNSQSRSSGPNAGRASTTAPSQSTAMSEANAGTALQAPLKVKQSPSTHTATGSSAASLETTSGGTPMSVGMPQGVFGLKGLSLTPGATATTPGPVIVSNTQNVKLDSGTQILLHVLSVETPQQAKK